MKPNVGGNDKTIRLVLGGLCLVLAMFLDVGTVFRILLYAGALIGLSTGLLNYCPINHMLGVNTRKKPEEWEKPGARPS